MAQGVTSSRDHPADVTRGPVRARAAVAVEQVLSSKGSAEGPLLEAASGLIGADRRLLFELVLGSLRWLRRLDWVLGKAAGRPEFREAHLGHARAAVARGELVLGGAMAEPVDGAVLVFRAETPDVPEQFAVNDPYVAAGLVKRWMVREWTVVIGAGAEALDLVS